MSDLTIIAEDGRTVLWTDAGGEFRRIETAADGDLLQVVTFPDLDRWADDQVDRGQPDPRLAP